MQGKHVDTLAELSKIGLLLRIFPPEESSVSTLTDNLQNCNSFPSSWMNIVLKLSFYNYSSLSMIRLGFSYLFIVILHLNWSCGYNSIWIIVCFLFTYFKCYLFY